MKVSCCRRGTCTTLMTACYLLGGWLLPAQLLPGFLQLTRLLVVGKLHLVDSSQYMLSCWVSKHFNAFQLLRGICSWSACLFSVCGIRVSMALYIHMCPCWAHTKTRTWVPLKAEDRPGGRPAPQQVHRICQAFTPGHQLRWQHAEAAYSLQYCAVCDLGWIGPSKGAH